MERLQTLHKESLLSPWALLAFTNLAEPSRSMDKERATLCQRGIRLAPARLLVTRCAVQLAIAGRGADSESLARAVLRAYPAERTATVDELARAARDFPEAVPLARLDGQRGGASPEKP
jgi:hypothetical protein